VTFVLGALALLATPGPTNTLLATSAAANGLRPSLGLLAGELLGYLLAIVALRVGFGPIIAAMPAFATALSAVVCTYLLYLACMLWRHGERQSTGAPVSWQRVFVTTLLNPKAVVFAFTLLPSRSFESWAELLHWLGVLSVLIVAVGASWMIIGASLRRGTRRMGGPRVAYRAGAVALVLLAGVVSGRVAGLA
jgi:threonine/homoserine/homoserine lactone efflux protein